MVKVALFRWSHRRVPRHTSTKATRLCRRTAPGEDDFGGLRVVEVVKELGRITCVRGEFCQKQDSSFGGGAVVICLGGVPMEKEVQDRVQVEVAREE